MGRNLDPFGQRRSHEQLRSALEAFRHRWWSVAFQVRRFARSVRLGHPVQILVLFGGVATILGFTLGLRLQDEATAAENSYGINLASSLTAFGISIVCGAPLVNTLIRQHELGLWRRDLNRACWDAADGYVSIAKAIMPYMIQKSQRRRFRWFRRTPSFSLLSELPKHLAAREAVVGGWLPINFPQSARDFRKIGRYLDRVAFSAEDPSLILTHQDSRAAPSGTLTSARTSLNDVQANALVHSPLGPRITTLLERIRLDLTTIEEYFDEKPTSIVGRPYAKNDDTYSQHPNSHFHELSVDVLRSSLSLVEILARRSW
jgi:hypothetical protein